MTAPIFGQPLLTVERGRYGATKAGTNPMLAHGKGPEGKKCATCKSLGYVTYSQRIYKCRRRGLNGQGTDHRMKWPACVYYEEEGEGDAR